MAEVVLDEVAKEFGGQDPARPVIRESLEKSKRTVQELREGLQRIGEAFDLPEPSEEQLKLLREIVERAERLHS